MTVTKEHEEMIMMGHFCFVNPRVLAVIGWTHQEFTGNRANPHRISFPEIRSTST
jgi:hypothetical protein